MPTHLRGEAEEGDLPQLGLGDEAAPRHFGGEREDVEPAHVVGDVHRALRRRHALRRGRARARPPTSSPSAPRGARSARRSTRGPCRTRNESGDDDDRAEQGRHHQRDEADE